MKFIIAAAAIALAGLSAPAAQAADCKPLVLISTIPMLGSQGPRLVNVTINDQPARMLIDTGGSLMQITRAMTKALKLPIKQGNVEMYDINGNRSRDEASIERFTLGEMRGSNMSLPVSPNDSLASFADGIIANDLMRHYDTDLDFGSNTMNLFLPDHCPGGVLYWQAPAVAVVPIRMVDNQITIPIMVDGHQFSAIVDTGASRTTMLAPAAKRAYNLTADSPDMVPAGFVNGDYTVPYHHHTFGLLTFGDISVKNPLINIIPDVMRKKRGPRSTGRQSRQVQPRSYPVAGIDPGHERIAKAACLYGF